MKKSLAAGLVALSITGTSVVAALPVAAAEPGAPTTSAPKPPRAERAPDGERRGRIGAKVDEIASFLGLTAQDLKAQLRTASLGTIAGAKRPELIALMTKNANERIDAAVAKGRLPQEQADKLKAKLVERVPQIVDRVGGGKGRPGGERRPR